MVDGIFDEVLWWNKQSEALVNSKKAMAGRIVDKIQQVNWSVNFFGWKNKDYIIDYLVEEWVVDSLKWLAIWLWLSIFNSDFSQLESIKEKISNVSTQDELDNLESELISQLDWGVAVPQRESQGGGSGRSVDNWNSVENVAVWEAANVPFEQRMKWLFPDWVPTSDVEMKTKYITNITVPILTSEWEEKDFNLQVHKKLANEYIAIFKEMKNAWIFVDTSSTWCYNWRKMRWSPNQSHHSYWSAIDLNYAVNWWDFWDGKERITDPNSPYFNNEKCVSIWKKHGFYWWWEWDGNKDPMHFSYMNA